VREILFWRRDQIAARFMAASSFLPMRRNKTSSFPASCRNTRTVGFTRNRIGFPDRTGRDVRSVSGTAVPSPGEPPRAWYFDTDAGKDEVLFRRIGKNELAAMEACRDLVTAQKHISRTRRDDLPAICTETG